MLLSVRKLRTPYGAGGLLEKKIQKTRNSGVFWKKTNSNANPRTGNNPANKKKLGKDCSLHTHKLEVLC